MAQCEGNLQNNINAPRSNKYSNMNERDLKKKKNYFRPIIMKIAV